MADIVQILRKRQEFFLNGAHWMMSAEPDRDCAAAADEIERLRSEADEIRRLVLQLYAETTGPAVHRART